MNYQSNVLTLNTCRADTSRKNETATDVLMASTVASTTAEHTRAGSQSEENLRRVRFAFFIFDAAGTSNLY